MAEGKSNGLIVDYIGIVILVSAADLRICLYKISNGSIVKNCVSKLLQYKNAFLNNYIGAIDG